MGTLLLISLLTWRKVLRPFSTIPPSKAPDFLTPQRHNHPHAHQIGKFYPVSANHKPPTCGLSFSFLFVLLFLSRQSFLPQAFHPKKNHRITKPELNRRHLTTRSQTGNQPSPSTIPPSSYFDLGLQCSIIAIKPANGASKKRCRVQLVEERKDEGWYFHEVSFVG